MAYRSYNDEFADAPNLIVSAEEMMSATLPEAPVDPEPVHQLQLRLDKLHRMMRTVDPETPRYKDLQSQADQIQRELTPLQEQLGGTVFRIASAQRDIVQQRARDLSRRAERAGWGKISFALLGHLHYAPMPGARGQVRLPPSAVEAKAKAAGRPAPNRLRMVEYEWAALDGPAPMVAGHEIVARLEPEGAAAPGVSVPALDAAAGQRIYRLPNLSPAARLLDIEAWRGQAQWCDHCQTLRRRKYTYLVRSADGAVRQVGRSCMADYTGEQLPERMLRLAEQLELFMHELDTFTGLHEIDPQLSRAAYRTLHFMIACAILVRTEGEYRTKSSLAIYERDKGTADRAWQMIVDRNAKPERRAGRTWPDPTSQDRSLARAVLAFARERATDEDAELAAIVGSIAAGEWVMRSQAALLGSAFAVYAARGIEAEQLPTEHFGTIGERVALHLQVDRVVALQGDDGSPYWLYALHDSRGRAFRLTRSRGDLLAGARYHLNANVRAHETDERFGAVTSLANARSVRKSD